MDLLATTKDGSAFAVNVTGDTTVNLEGNLLAKAVASGDGTAYSLMTDKGTLVVSGQMSPCLVMLLFKMRDLFLLDRMQAVRSI